MIKEISFLALTLAACGNSTTPTSLPDGSPNCKGNRVWNATLEECVEPTVDASVVDSAVDAGYVQKYQGKLYGVLNYDSNSRAPRFVTFDFATGKLESLLGTDGAILESPYSSGIIANPTLSPDAKNIVAYTDNNLGLSEIFNINRVTGETHILFTDVGLPSLSWKDNTRFFVSVEEIVGETANGDRDWKTRIYEKSLDGTFSDWIVEQDGRFRMSLISSSPYTHIFGIVFTCKNRDATFYEFCKTTDYPFHGEFSYKSTDLHIFPVSSPQKLYAPSNPEEEPIIYFPCGHEGERPIYLCSFNVYTGDLLYELKTRDESLFWIATFSPDSKNVILNSHDIYSREDKTYQGRVMPERIEFEGKPLDVQPYWFAWR